jgi:hypothetical protein
MTKEEILQKHEDQNEYHFHQVDREWIMEAMQEYADQQLLLYGVVVPEGTLPYDQKCDDACKFYCTKGNTQYPKCLR